MTSDPRMDEFVEEARSMLKEGYGRDYALGAVRGLAVRNMVEVTLPECTENFYPIVKIHEMALRELEDIFYAMIQQDEDLSREMLVAALVEGQVWE
jgi:hypothetical protein